MNDWIEKQGLPLVLAFAAGVLVMSVAMDGEREVYEQQAQALRNQAAACWRIGMAGGGQDLRASWPAPAGIVAEARP